MSLRRDSPASMLPCYAQKVALELPNSGCRWPEDWCLCRHNVVFAASSCLYVAADGQKTDVYASTVRSVLQAAAEDGMQSVAMPLIGCGNAGWPIKLAAQINVEQVLDFLSTDGKTSTLKVLHYAPLSKQLSSSDACATTCKQWTIYVAQL